MNKSIYLGSTPIAQRRESPRGEFVEEEGRTWYRIKNFETIAPFLVSVTNPGNVWMFVSTTGGLTAGRVNADSAIFPYITSDKIDEAYLHTGALTLIRVRGDSRTQLWKPLAWDGERVYDSVRSFYKSAHGDAIMFEERNADLGLEFRYGWEISPAYGIHRFARLTNMSGDPLEVSVLDGMRNILPAGVTAQMQSLYSNLLDAYKRCEYDPQTGLGIYSLSAAPTDLAEPSESLRASTVWSYGLERGTLLLSEDQLPQFLSGAKLESEYDIKGRRGAYLQAAELRLAPSSATEWGFCAEVEQSHAAVHNLRLRLSRNREGLVDDLGRDVRAGREELGRILERNDAAQQVGSRESKYHHAANVLFNIMRGGYFVEGYSIKAAQFAQFVQQWNERVYAAQERQLRELPASLPISELHGRCDASGDPQLRRLAYEYLPLTFSRRHGDPSRPWNKFHIQTHDAQGNAIIGYQGNWRDIFQNWEALCLSYPDYFPSVIAKFLNATTADGYNPYRISQNGIDWEVPEPENPWSNIGYWGDHQIVYLSRLMEHAEAFAPGVLTDLLNDPIFVFADVPYRIKPFKELIADPRDTIEFDHGANERIGRRAESLGADGRLIPDQDGMPLRATMLEKLLILLLAKTGNYVAGGGIWLNTQRPEWNDANNALAGWGLSVVTVAYLARFTDLVAGLLAGLDTPRLKLHAEVARWLKETVAGLRSIAPEDSHAPGACYALLTALGTASDNYRDGLYKSGFQSEEYLEREEIAEYLSLWRAHLVSTLKRTYSPREGFQSYQLLSIEGNEAHVKPLYLMLEGQVSGLASGILSPAEVVSLLDALKDGPLYREDQHSYMLYPNRELPGFLRKNRIEAEDAEGLRVLKRPEKEWSTLLERDENGIWHFDGSFHNARDLEQAAAHLSAEERNELLLLFEKTFDHASFTGRSGTFFAYEGLGSIYWHMVSKLLLAIQEQLVEAVLRGESTETVAALKARYIDVRSGLGFNKDPATYGAVPVDPYSHTPWGQGAKQPGMTGQVKEEVVARYAELGLVVRKARILFLPELILEDQFRPETGELEFSYCGVDFTVVRAGRRAMAITFTDGTVTELPSLEIPAELSAEVFRRSGRLRSVRVYINEDRLKK